MMEPDEDEDPTRMCERCATRPRWSKHENCKLCIYCGRPAKHIARRKRWIFGDPAPKEDADPYVKKLWVKRQRYRALRALGATPKQAAAKSWGVHLFAREQARLQAARAVAGGSHASDTARDQSRLPASADE